MTGRPLSEMDREELLAQAEDLRRRLTELEQRDAVEELALSEARYRALVEGSSDFIYVLDRGGHFTFANTEISHLLGYAPEEIIGRHYTEVLHPADVETVGRAFAERRTGERATRRLEVRLQSRAGDTRQVEMDVRHFAISASGLYRGGDYVGTHGVARDITERKYQETKRIVLQDVREAVWSMVGVADITHVLEAIRRGLETMALPFQHCAVNVVEMGEPPMLSCYSSYGSAGIARRGEWMVTDTDTYPAGVARIWRAGRPEYWPDLERHDPYHERDRLVELFGPLRCLVDVPFSYGTLTINSLVPGAFSERDISFFQELAEALSEGYRRMEDLQQLALSEQRYRTLVETPNFVVMLLDPEGSYLYVSPQIEDWLGYTPEEFYRNADIRSQIIHPDDLAATEAFHDLDQAEPRRTLEYRWRQRNGRYRWASGSLFPIYESAEDRQINRISLVQVVVQDITERKEAEEQIRTSLAEKEVLLKEIHHRVKNNLQIVSSLLHLQSANLEDEALLRAFDDSQHRIRTMALIHEELYQSGDLARIDFVGYVRRLTDNLFESFGVDAERIALSVAVDNVLLTIDKAIPLGLVVNELVSNSLKYAFPGSRRGQIRIALAAAADGSFALTVGDDGVGLPAAIDVETADSLGLRLVTSLASQLKARVEVDRAAGTTFRLIRE
ncbi:MAG: PAS domain S-box protein [Gemmatimonadota bacterium]